jgi:hypothetical protein
VPVLARTDLVSVLERCGLPTGIANRFLDLVTLKASSKDLFDSPLIQRHDGKLMMFGPALITSNITVVLLSTLASLQEPLSSKGRALERAILGLLLERKLHACGFKVNRNGEEYEYDAVLAWGDYVFVFECKNNSLSNNRPMNAYYFDLGVRSAVRQVKRLVDALQRFPDILAEKMQIDISGKKIIPCVLNSLPYARIGELDGVYCTDASILDRFLSDRHFYLKLPSRVRENVTIMHRVSIASLWEGETPSPEDLLRQLKDPFQLKIVKGHTQLQVGTFPIARDQFVASSELVRTPWTVESMSEVFGLSAGAIVDEIDGVQRQIQSLKRTRGKTRKRKPRRAKKSK